MRLGAQPCLLAPDSLAHRLYEQDRISERHRHRYEFNNNYRQVLEQAGLCISGMSHDNSLAEVVEIPGHPWFIGFQFHPEFASTPRDGHPLFTGFIRAALAYQRLQAPVAAAAS
jgi:CTP synthase